MDKRAINMDISGSRTFSHKQTAKIGWRKANPFPEPSAEVEWVMETQDVGDKCDREISLLQQNFCHPQLQ
jgi:hypothetical protein